MKSLFNKLDRFFNRINSLTTTRFLNGKTTFLKTKRIATVVSGLSILLLYFQNCAPARFSAVPTNGAAVSSLVPISTLNGRPFATAETGRIAVPRQVASLEQVVPLEQIATPTQPALSIPVAGQTLLTAPRLLAAPAVPPVSQVEKQVIKYLSITSYWEKEFQLADGSQTVIEGVKVDCLGDIVPGTYSIDWYFGCEGPACEMPKAQLVLYESGVFYVKVFKRGRFESGAGKGFVSGKNTHCDVKFPLYWVP